MSSITEEKVRSTFSESDLQQKFGFMLKPQQVAGITSVLQGKHTFVALPTGFGKSAVYVLPPLLLDVVSWIYGRWTSKFVWMTSCPRLYFIHLVSMARGIDQKDFLI